MGIIKKVWNYISDNNYRFIVNRSHGFYKTMPDREYLERYFRAVMGYELNLSNPRTYNEKLQWLKLNDRRNIYTMMVDKYEAKNYVKELIGEKYIIPTLGVWDSFEDIDFDGLPNQFVLKCTHDSGGLVICRNKLMLDLRDAKRKIEKSLKRNYYYEYREWPYKNIKPRVIAEKYLEDPKEKKDGEEPVLCDYKLHCFGGNFFAIFVAEGRFSKNGTRYHYFDRNWNYLPYCPYSDIDQKQLQLLKPKCLDEMIEISEKLSAGLPQLRVDLYEVKGRVYFGELTFFSQSGFDNELTYDADCTLGNLLSLPKVGSEKTMDDVMMTWY